jgi:hypothetical protein
VYTDDGGSTVLWNVGKLIPVYTGYKPEHSHLQVTVCLGERELSFNII